MTAHACVATQVDFVMWTLLSKESVMANTQRAKAKRDGKVYIAGVSTTLRLMGIEWKSHVLESHYQRLAELFDGKEVGCIFDCVCVPFLACTWKA